MHAGTGRHSAGTAHQGRPSRSLFPCHFLMPSGQSPSAPAPAPSDAAAVLCARTRAAPESVRDAPQRLSRSQVIDTGLGLAMVKRDIPGQSQEHRQSMIDDFLDAVIGDVRDDDLLSGGIRHVDIVETNPQPRDMLAAGRSGDDLSA